ncbi:hypothetical protein ACSBR2_036664 [Camellia fascicularis]
MIPRKTVRDVMKQYKELKDDSRRKAILLIVLGQMRGKERQRESGVRCQESGIGVKRRRESGVGVNGRICRNFDRRSQGKKEEAAIPVYVWGRF